MVFRWGCRKLLEVDWTITQGKDPANSIETSKPTVNPSLCPACHGPTYWKHEDDGWWAHCDRCKVSSR